jgi:hypothetical protein
VAFPQSGSSSTESNLEVLIFVEGGNPEKKGENQQTTLLTYDPRSRNRTRDHRGEASAPTATSPMLPIIASQKIGKVIIR